MKILCIGGGTGLSTLIKAWKRIGVTPKVIVATTDNGGCSGRLVKAGSPVPWGDIRKVLCALADGHQLNPILNQRYKDLKGFDGHCFGNLMLEAFYQQRGSVSGAISAMETHLGLSKCVFPMSECAVDLLAIGTDGKTTLGEEAVDAQTLMPMTLLLNKYVSPSKDLIRCIRDSDIICLGPGSLITSVLPALLVPEIQKAIIAHKGLRLFIQNCGQEKGPVNTLSSMKQAHWLKSQTHPDLFNAELSNGDVSINGERYSLVKQARQMLFNESRPHNTINLAQALALTSCLSNAYHFPIKHNKLLSNMSRVLFDSCVENSF